MAASTTSSRPWALGATGSPELKVLPLAAAALIGAALSVMGESESIAGGARADRSGPSFELGGRVLHAFAGSWRAPETASAAGALLALFLATCTVGILARQRAATLCAALAVPLTLLACVR